MEKAAAGGALFSRRAAQRVRALREERQWSRERLAQELAKVGQPLGQNGIYKIEQYPDPARRLTVDELGALAVVFGTTPHALMGWDDLRGMAGWDELTSSPEFIEQHDSDPITRDEFRARMAALLTDLVRVRDQADLLSRQLAEEGTPPIALLDAAVAAQFEEMRIRASLADLTKAFRDVGGAPDA